MPREITSDQFVQELGTLVTNPDPKFQPMRDFFDAERKKYPNGIDPRDFARDFMSTKPDAVRELRFTDIRQEPPTSVSRSGQRLGGATSSSILTRPLAEGARGALESAAESGGRLLGWGGKQSEDFSGGFFRGLADVGVDLTSPANLAMTAASYLTPAKWAMLAKQGKGLWKLAKWGLSGAKAGLTGEMAVDAIQSVPAAVEAYRAGNMKKAGEETARAVADVAFGTGMWVKGRGKPKSAPAPAETLAAPPAKPSDIPPLPPSPRVGPKEAAQPQYEEGGRRQPGPPADRRAPTTLEMREGARGEGYFYSEELGERTAPREVAPDRPKPKTTVKPGAGKEATPAAEPEPPRARMRPGTLAVAGPGIEGVEPGTFVRFEGRTTGGIVLEVLDKQGMRTGQKITMPRGMTEEQLQKSLLTPEFWMAQQRGAQRAGAQRGRALPAPQEPITTPPPETRRIEGAPQREGTPPAGMPAPASAVPPREPRMLPPATPKEGEPYGGYPPEGAPPSSRAEMPRLQGITAREVESIAKQYGIDPLELRNAVHAGPEEMNKFLNQTVTQLSSEANSGSTSKQFQKSIEQAKKRLEAYNAVVQKMKKAAEEPPPPKPPPARKEPPPNYGFADLPEPRQIEIAQRLLNKRGERASEKAIKRMVEDLSDPKRNPAELLGVELFALFQDLTGKVAESMKMSRHPPAPARKVVEPWEEPEPPRGPVRPPLAASGGQ